MSSGITKSASPYKFSGYEDLIIVGDSRVYYMSKISNITKRYPNTKFIGLIGSGYSWLNAAAVPQLKKALSDGKKHIVVFNHGLNDLKDQASGHYDDYIKLYNTIQSSYGAKNKIYFMSVNPVIDGSRLDRVQGNGEVGFMTNRIKAFNTKMKNYWGEDQYLDIYDHLITYGYDSYDGIHYTYKTGSDIYEQLLMMIAKQIPQAPKP